MAKDGPADVLRYINYEKCTDITQEVMAKLKQNGLDQEPEVKRLTQDQLVYAIFFNSKDRSEAEKLNGDIMGMGFKGELFDEKSNYDFDKIGLSYQSVIKFFLISNTFHKDQDIVTHKREAIMKDLRVGDSSIVPVWLVKKDEMIDEAYNALYGISSITGVDPSSTYFENKVKKTLKTREDELRKKCFQTLVDHLESKQIDKVTRADRTPSQREPSAGPSGTQGECLPTCDIDTETRAHRTPSQREPSAGPSGTQGDTSDAPLEISEAIEEYPKLTKGVFLLIKNFADDLQGYNRDEVGLKEFFEKDLGYTFIAREDCSYDETFAAIRDAKAKITTDVNRFIFAILSHGDQEGVLTANDEKKIRVSKIIEEFKHDKVPVLKDLPKMFIIQTCSGPNMVQTAGSNASRLDKSPVDLDILQIKAATESNVSMVASSGSWLIQEMLQVFRRMYRDTDVETMLKQITSKVAQKEGTIADGRAARQVPIRESTMRKMFFLD